MQLNRRSQSQEFSENFFMRAKHSIVVVKMNTSAKNRLESICHRRGMTQLSVLSRLVRWFCLQDEQIQTQLLQSLTKESMADVAKSVLKTFD
jgi:hypothetical protein